MQGRGQRIPAELSGPAAAGLPTPSNNSPATNLPVRLDESHASAAHSVRKEKDTEKVGFRFPFPRQFHLLEPVSPPGVTPISVGVLRCFAHELAAAAAQ